MTKRRKRTSICHSLFVLCSFSLDKHVEEACAELARVTALHGCLERRYERLVGRTSDFHHIAGAELRRRYRKLQHARVIRLQSNREGRVITSLGGHLLGAIRSRSRAVE